MKPYKAEAHPKNARSTTTLVTLCTTAAIWVVGCQPAAQKQDYQPTAVERINNRQNEGRDTIIAQLEQRIATLRDTVKALANQNKTIAHQYQKLYEIIRYTAADKQPALTDSLLAIHRTKPLRRD